MTEDNTQPWDRPDDEDDYRERMDEMVADAQSHPCVLCSGPLVVLGSLGRLDWYRCRNCGAQYSQENR